MPVHDPAPLVVRDVSLTLRGRAVLDRVSLELAAGETLGLVGRNGAGKSSLLHVIGHLRRARCGEVLVHGHPAGSAAARRAMTMVLQDVDFPVTVRVGEVLCHVARHYTRAEHPAAVAERLGLQGCWDRQTGGLSGGEERKLAVACALLSRPSLVVLDEPFAGIDPTTCERLWQVLRDVAGRGGAVLLSSHELDGVQQHADRVVVLDGGRVVASGSPRTLVESLALSRVVFRSADPNVGGVGASIDVTHTHGRWSVTTRDPDGFVVRLVRSGVAFSDLVIERLPLGAAVDAVLAGRHDDAEATAGHASCLG